MQKALNTAADPLVGQRLEGRYLLEAQIARGGMSTVYRAIDERLERRVAVKIMSSALGSDPAFADRFAREARAVAKLSHVNVVAVHDQGRDGGRVFLVMELITGRTLRDLLRERGRLTETEATAVMEPVLGALAAAHRAGLVHRDVKPENILLSDDGVVKVADFGLARAMDADASATRTGLMMGTVAYCAPEQVSKGQADQRSDVYSAGVVLFELLTGSVPYKGDSAMAVAYQHVHSRIPAPSSRVAGIDEPIDDLIIRATDPDPQFRPGDAATMLAELHDIRVQLQLPLTPVPRRPPGGMGTATDRATMENTTQVLRPGSAPARAGDTVVVAVPPTPAAAPPPLASPPRAISSRQRRRRRGLIATLVVLALGALLAFGTWWLAAGRYTSVPSVAGEPVDTATNALRNAGFDKVATTQAFDEDTAKGAVVGTSPAAGTRTQDSAQITIIISSGQERYLLPQVKGGTEAAARTALAALKATSGADAIVVTSKTQSDDTVAAGVVIGTDPAAGERVKRGTTVTILISSGPPLIALPSVTGSTADDATTTLEQAGFTVRTTDTTSDSVPTGTVISQSPTGGEAPKHSTVTLTVSQGPDYVDLPSVGGRSAADATKILQAAGFSVQTNKVYGGLLNLVVGVDVSAADRNDKGKVRHGANVTINVA